MMLLLHPLFLFSITAHCHCTNAYAPASGKPNNYHRWSSSRLFSTTSGADVALSPPTTTITTTMCEENITTRDLLSLDYIRSTLIRQEETIIFALIERAQFRHNDIVYKVGGVPGLGTPPGSSGSTSNSNNNLPNSADDEKEDQPLEELSFLDFMFIGTVRYFIFCSLHARIK